MKGLFGLGKKKDDAHKKYLVQYDQQGCIGAGTCEAVNPEFWKIRDDKKADLVGSEMNGSLFELLIEEKDFEKMKAAAEGCPKNVIHITDRETGEKVI